MSADYTQSGAILTEARDGLMIVRLNRPDKMNPLTAETKAGLAAAVADFVSDSAHRCLLIIGTGKAFCAGGDVSTMMGEQPPLAVRVRVSESTEGWARALLDCEKPVITAINGAAVGAGFALAMLGDIVLISEDAYFIPGFSAMGAAADLGLALTLPRAVGMPRAKNILLRNLRISGSEAAAMGLVSEVLPAEDFAARTIEIGRQIAAAPTVSIGLTKMLVGMAYQDSLSTFFKVEALAQAAAFSTGDREEGVAAFLEKRRPEFRGK